MSTRRKRIGLLSHLGHGNLGDDATFAAAMQNIKERWPEAEFIGLSLNPFDTSERHGVPAYAIRHDSKLPAQVAAISEGDPGPSWRGSLKASLKKFRPFVPFFRAANLVVIRMPQALVKELTFLVESFQVARSLDLLIICGGGQLLDSWHGGPWGFPWTVFKWIALAKISWTKCYIVNVGAGPVDHVMSKWFYKNALSLADYVSYRDRDSERLMRSIGSDKSSEVCVDMVYGLGTLGAPSRAFRKGSKLNVGFSPMAYCDPQRYWDQDYDAYNSFLGKCARFGEMLVKTDRQVTLFSTDIWFDSVALDYLTNVLTNYAGISDPPPISRPSITGIAELLELMAPLDCVVTCRFHGVVFAHLMNTPVIALSHHPKVIGLMKELGLSEYCLDIRDFRVETLESTFMRLEDNLGEVKKQMAKTLPKRRQDLKQQFDALFPLDRNLQRSESRSSQNALVTD